MNIGAALVFEFEVELEAAGRPPGQGGRKKGIFVGHEVDEGVVGLTGEVYAVEPGAVRRERTGRVYGRAIEVPRTDLLLDRIVRLRQRALGDDIHHAPRLDAAIEYRGRPFQNFHLLDVRRLLVAERGLPQPIAIHVGAGVEAANRVGLVELVGRRQHGADVLRRLLDIDDLLIVHQLARDHLDCDRRIVDRRRGLGGRRRPACDVVSAGRIANLDRRQFGHLLHRHPLDRICAIRRARPGQARSREQAGERVLRAQVTGERRSPFALDGFRRVLQPRAGLGGERVKGRGEFLRDQTDLDCSGLGMDGCGGAKTNGGDDGEGKRLRSKSHVCSCAQPDLRRQSV